MTRLAAIRRRLEDYRDMGDSRVLADIAYLLSLLDRCRPYVESAATTGVFDFDAGIHTASEDAMKARALLEEMD